MLKPSTSKASDAGALVAFGVNPMDAAEKKKGVGIYSSPFCLAKDKLGNTENYASNCFIEKKVAGLTTTFHGPYGTEIINALELVWTLPYEIPDDRTEATISCRVDDDSVDYIKVYQSSVMADGFGKGNCWYDGAPAKAPYAHSFKCLNTGKLVKDSKLRVGF